MDVKPFARQDAYWIYPDEEEPPFGKKILLLTRNKTCVVGMWEKEGYLAWHPLPKQKKYRK